MFNPVNFLLCHLLGDFWFQTDWMALQKNKKTWPCLVHVLLYTACFLVLTRSIPALLFIGGTHFIIDRFPIILKRLIWLKNHFPQGKYPPFRMCDSTGYYDDSPYNSYRGNKHTLKRYGQPRHKEITWWLYIIIDNMFHLICNLTALTFFS